MPANENQGQGSVDPATDEPGASAVDDGIGDGTAGERGVDSRGRTTEQDGGRATDRSAGTGDDQPGVRNPDQPGGQVTAGAADEFDDRIVEVLSWVLDTETRARIYVSLRRRPGRTSDEVADATGLYPSTVRESLAALTEDGVVVRQKRQSGGVGNNPYEYRAITPSELVRDTVGQVQEQLNDLCRIDSRRDDSDDQPAGPVTIQVEADDMR